MGVVWGVVSLQEFRFLHANPRRCAVERDEHPVGAVFRSGCEVLRWNQSENGGQKVRERSTNNLQFRVSSNFTITQLHSRRVLRAARDLQLFDGGILRDRGQDGGAVPQPNVRSGLHPHNARCEQDMQHEDELCRLGGAVRLQVRRVCQDPASIQV